MSIVTPTPSVEEFRALQRVFHDRAGVFIPESKSDQILPALAERLDELELDALAHYLQYLTSGPHQEQEFNELWSRLDLGVARFFQNVDQLEWLEMTAIPGLIEAREDARRLRVFLPACSSGEDAYTVAISIQRALGPRLAEFRVTILGADFADSALEAARGGVYPEASLACVDPTVRRKYFSTVPGGLQITDEIHDMVAFERLDLRNDLAVRRLGAWDIIVCRNHLGLLDVDRRADTVSLLADQLSPGGALLIGPDNAVASPPDCLVREPVAGAFTRSA